MTVTMVLTIFAMAVVTLMAVGIATFVTRDMIRDSRRGKQMAVIEAEYYRARMREDGLDPWGDEGESGR